MSDINVAPTEPTAEPPKANIIAVPITKGGGTIELNLDTIPIEVYQAMLELGAKELMNRGMSKITVKGLSGTDLEKARAAAMAKGAENAEAIRTGRVRLPGRKAATGSKASKAVVAEARRLARNVVKDELRKAGKKISHYTAKAITEAADALIAADASFVKQAEANLASRVAPPAAIDINALIKEDAGLVKKAAEKKKQDKVDPGILSAKQAGLTAKAKPAPLH